MKPVLRWFGLVCALTVGVAFAQSRLTITTGSALPNASLGVSYTTQLRATGGVSPYTWGLYNPPATFSAGIGGGGALPPGLTLSSGGVISGTPSKTGTFSFEVIASDSEPQPQTAIAAFQITVQLPALTITSTSPLPN